MKKNTSKLIIFLILLIIIIYGTIFYVVLNSNSHILKKKGYSPNEISYIETLNEEQIKKIIELDYYDYIVPILKNENNNFNLFDRYLNYYNKYKLNIDFTIEVVNNDLDDIIYKKDMETLLTYKYYIPYNFNRYINYYTSHDTSIENTISIVNANADKNWYSDDHDTDLNKNELILVNKFYKLSKDYEPTDLVTIPSDYSTWGSIRKEAYDSFFKMVNDIKSLNLIIKTTSPYRSYEKQEEIFNSYVDSRGLEVALLYAAKPAYSEHQTGLAMDFVNSNGYIDYFEASNEFKWLQDNAHKYGFILRYPKGKEYLTGYNYEPWHYRYVGVNAATYIKENNIVFEEYYAYFCEYKGEC